MPPMLPEPMILHRHDGGRQLRRQVLQPERFAHQIAVGRESAAGAVLQHQRGPPLGIHRGLGARQIAGSPNDDARQDQQAPDGQDHAGAKQPSE